MPCKRFLLFDNNINAHTFSVSVLMSNKGFRAGLPW